MHQLGFRAIEIPVAYTCSDDDTTSNYIYVWLFKNFLITPVVFLIIQKFSFVESSRLIIKPNVKLILYFFFWHIEKGRF